MKRSIKFKRQSNCHFIKSAIWLLLAITCAAFGWAYRDGWASTLCGIAFLMSCFSVCCAIDGYNKRRLSLMEARYEKSMAIRHNLQSI